MYDGQALALADGPLGTIEQGKAAWLQLDVKALHNASEIEVRVADNADFGIKYPNEVDYSSLATGSRIVVDTEDYAAIEFDSLDLEPGVYTVPIEVSYFVGLTKITQTVERTIEVIDPSAATDPVDPDPAATDPVDPDPVDPDPVDPGPVDPGPVDPDPVDPGPVVYTMANGIEGWKVNPYGNDTAVTGVWGFGQPPTGIWQDLVLELGSTPSGNPGLFTLSGTGDEMGDHDVDGGETSILSPVFSLPDVKKIKLEFDYYLSYLRNATSDDSLQVIMITKDGNKVILNEQAKDKDHEAKWETEKVDLKKYAGQDVQFLIVVGDREDPSFIEAAIDGFIITAE